MHYYDELSAIEKALDLPEGSLRSIPYYARMDAAKAISKVLEMERKSIFRPGLYYIVLADLVANTSFNEKHGNAYADLRTQWFHTAAIQAVGTIALNNYATFNKTIGDASLLIFSSIKDVIVWSKRFDHILGDYNTQFQNEAEFGIEGLPPVPAGKLTELSTDFALRARRLVHAGEVRYAGFNDPLSLAVSQTFKMEKSFTQQHLGCTELVATTVKPELVELGYQLVENAAIKIAGQETETMTYYIQPLE
ncbi:MAG TPA: hypothetical protein PL070_13630 [Flavobacteriales bacterium]|nr:hypothetical protein [Flavobacteriales bacterium]